MMLVISRSEGDALVVDNITVTVVEIGADDVLLQIDGPPGTDVQRGEEFLPPRLADIAEFISQQR